MEGQTTFVSIPRQDYERMMRVLDSLDELVSNLEEKLLTKADLPKTLTAADLKNYYGIGRDKLRKAVKDKEFPQPIVGFDKPKRWNTAEVEAAIRGGEVDGVQAA